MNAPFGIIPYTNVRHASSYYRCFEVVERSSLFRIFDGQPCEVLFHQKAIHTEHFGKAKVNVLDICDRTDFPSFDGLDCLTVTTEELAGYYRNLTPLPVHVLPEILPIRKTLTYVDSDYEPTQRLAWFGLWHQEAPRFILSALEYCANVYLMFMSHKEEPYRTYWHQKLLPHLKVPHDYFNWSWEHFQSRVRSCHVTIIPTEQTDWWRYKSPNRLVLSVSAGTPVVCSSTPAYSNLTPYTVKKFSDFAIVLAELRMFPEKRKDLWSAQREAIEPLLPWNAINQWNQLAERLCAHSHQA